MLIIIEGVDGSGKSTLAQELAALLDGDVEILHRGVPTSHILDEYETPLLDYVPGTGKHIICDRWHIGPDVYGPIKRNDGGLDAAVRNHMNAYLLGKGAILVYTEMPIEPLLARMRSRGEDYLKEDEVEDVIALYRQVISKSPLPTIESKTGVHDAEKIIACAKLYEEAASLSGSFKSYAGARKVQYLLVGNSITPIAFMPYEGTESHDIVTKYGSNSRIVRVGYVDSKEDLYSVWDAVNNPFVLAIGEDVLSLCKKANIPAVLANTSLADTEV